MVWALQAVRDDSFQGCPLQHVRRGAEIWNDEESRPLRLDLGALIDKPCARDWLHGVDSCFQALDLPRGTWEEEVDAKRLLLKIPLAAFDR